VITLAWIWLAVAIGLAAAAGWLTVTRGHHTTAARRTDAALALWCGIGLAALCTITGAGGSL